MGNLLPVQLLYSLCIGPCRFCFFLFWGLPPGFVSVYGVVGFGVLVCGWGVRWRGMAKQKFAMKDSSKPPVTGNAEGDHEDEDDISTVLETSPSVSRTIGTNDTVGPSKQPNEVGVLKEPPKKSFAEAVSKEQPRKTFVSLFHENRNPTKGLPVTKFESKNGEVDVSYEEIDTVVSAWGFSLLGYVAGGFPGIEAIKRLTNT